MASNLDGASTGSGSSIRDRRENRLEKRSSLLSKPVNDANRLQLAPHASQCQDVYNKRSSGDEPNSSDFDGSETWNDVPVDSVVAKIQGLMALTSRQLANTGTKNSTDRRRSQDTIRSSKESNGSVICEMLDIVTEDISALIEGLNSREISVVYTSDGLNEGACEPLESIELRDEASSQKHLLPQQQVVNGSRASAQLPRCDPNTFPETCQAVACRENERLKRELLELKAAQAGSEAEANDLRTSLRELRVQLAVALCPPDDSGCPHPGTPDHPAWVNDVAKRAFDAMRRLEDSERRAEQAEAKLAKMQQVNSSVNSQRGGASLCEEVAAMRGAVAKKAQLLDQLVSRLRHCDEAHSRATVALHTSKAMKFFHAT